MEQARYRSKLDPAQQITHGNPVHKGMWYPALDKGYVRVLDWMGSDLEVANDARVSFMKESTEWTAPDGKIVHFLGDHDHTSPFRHQMLKLEIYAPLMVARQWWKYVVGANFDDTGWNEASRRYVTLEPEFYIPKWRGAPANKKQGSDEPITDKGTLFLLNGAMYDLISDGVNAYNEALEWGAAPEQARCFLPAYAMYTAWRWTASLQAVCHFISQRTDPHAQWEIQQYAEPLIYVVQDLFPVAATSLLANHPLALRRALQAKGE